MRQIFRFYIPSISIIFTVCVVLSAAVSPLFGLHQYELDRISILTYFLFIVFLHGVTELAGRLPLKTNAAYTVFVLILQYALILWANRIIGWVNSDAFQPILYLTVLYLIIFFAHQFYFRHLRRLEANEINRLLQKRNL